MDLKIFDTLMRFFLELIMVLPQWVNSLWHRFPSLEKSSYRDRYQDCPLCRHGTLTTLIMMDAMSCDFCHHIFSIDLAQSIVQLPLLRVEDSPHPLTWQWTGERWQVQSQVEKTIILWLWILCIAIVTIPSTLMSLAIHLFPTAPQGQGAWFPGLWLCLTIGSHLLVALWLLAEHYQWPFYFRCKFMLNQRIADYF